MIVKSVQLTAEDRAQYEEVRIIESAIREALESPTEVAPHELAINIWLKQHGHDTIFPLSEETA